MSIRITGGSFRGRQIASPLTSKTRPTSSKIREALFNILQGVEGFRVLDLFAGSGGVGIEALSRGAESLDAVEKNARQARSLFDSCKALGISDKVRVSVMDVFEFREKALKEGDRYDLIYADPPFTEAYPDLRPFCELLTPAGVAVFEIPSREIPDWTREVRIRPYGESSLVFFSASL